MIDSSTNQCECPIRFGTLDRDHNSALSVLLDAVKNISSLRQTTEGMLGHRPLQRSRSSASVLPPGGKTFCFVFEIPPQAENLKPNARLSRSSVAVAMTLFEFGMIPGPSRFLGIGKFNWKTLQDCRYQNQSISLQILIAFIAS